MRLVGSAGLWYQTMQSAISKMTWDAFVTAICNRFDKDEHNHLLRHFFHIKQTSSISEYTEQFGDIVHQLLAHDPSFPPSVITNRFIDGLKKEIRAVVMMHHPQDLDDKLVALKNFCRSKGLCSNVEKNGDPTIMSSIYLSQCSRRNLEMLT